MQTTETQLTLISPADELAAAKASPDGLELSPEAQSLYEAEGAARFAEHHRAVCEAPPVRDMCVWAPDQEGIWHTTCGEAHIFNAGGPRDNFHRYCPYCGRNVQERQARRVRPAARKP